MNLFEVINTYNQFLMDVFNYLKTNILKNFPDMELEISYNVEYSARGGNTVSARNLFYKIVVYMYAFDEQIDNIIYTKNRMIWVIIHEAFHQNQMYDIIKYKNDRQYRNFVECNVDYSAIKFINEHEQELTMRFGIPIYTYDLNKIRSLHGNPKVVAWVTNDNLDVKTFVSLVLYYIKMDANTLYNIYHNNQNIVINIIKGNFSDPIYIKSNGIMNYKSVNKIMSHYMGQGILDLLYNVSMSVNTNKFIINIYLKDELLTVWR